MDNDLKILIKIAMPIVLVNLLQSAYELTDAFWVGKLGTTALASLSLSFPLLFLSMTLGGGLVIGGSILMAQAWGKKNIEQVKKIASQTLLLAFFSSIILSFLGYIFTPSILPMISAEDTVKQDALIYMKTMFLSLVFIYLYFAFQSILRSTGEVVIPLLIVFGTVLLNLILDPFFIFTLKMGVGGAAISTLITEAISCFIGIVLLFKGIKHIKLEIKYLKPDIKFLKKLFLFSIPASIEQTNISISLIFMMLLVVSFGTDVIAAYGIGMRLQSFVIVPIIGFSTATSILVGQKLGANKEKQAIKIAGLSLRYSFLGLMIVGLFCFMFSHTIASIFLSDNPNAINMASEFIKILSLNFAFISTQITLRGVFRSAGNTGLAMGLSFLALWGVRLSSAYVLSKFTSLSYRGIWISFLISAVSMAAVTYFIFKKNAWIKKELLKHFE